MDVGRGVPKCYESRGSVPCEGDVADFKNMSLSTCDTVPNLVVLRQQLRAYVRTEIRRKKMAISRPAFKGHSRSSEPTQIDQLPCDFLLVIRGNHGPISYTNYEINDVFGRQSRISPNPSIKRPR